MAYSYCLSEDDYEGEINGIRIRWSSGAITHLQRNTGARNTPTGTVKALTENFVYLLAYRLEETEAVIKYESTRGGGSDEPSHGR